MAGDSGGSSQPTEQNITQSTLPKYLEPYVTDLARRAQAVSNQGYVPYDRQRIQDFDPLQKQAFTQAAGFGRKWGEFGADDAQRYMSPYQQAVTDTAIRKMNEQAKANMALSGLMSAQSGGYGGSGNAIMNAMTARTLQRDVGDRQAADRAASYLNAQQMFGADRENAYRNIQQLQGLGGLRQGLGQKRLDMAYADFLRQRDYPKEQLGFYSGILHGLPQQMGSTSLTYAQQPGMAQTLAGLAGAGYSAYRGLS
jgi:hypothetical protein